VEKVFIELNGARQGMFITQSHRSRPVLLYLHGGMPDFFLNEKYPTGLEKFFTMVWWEQRGSGMSYQPRAPQDLITVDQLRANPPPPRGRTGSCDARKQAETAAKGKVATRTQRMNRGRASQRPRLATATR